MTSARWATEDDEGPQAAIDATSTRMHLDHLADDAPADGASVGTWMEAAGGGGGALDLVVPADVAVGEVAGVVMPELDEHRCQRLHGAVALGGRGRLLWFPCQSWECANFRWYRARRVGGGLTRVLGPDLWFGFLHGARSVRSFTEAVRRADKEPLSRESGSSAYQYLSSTYTQNCHFDGRRYVRPDARSAPPGYLCLTVLGDRRIVLTNVDVTSRRRHLAPIGRQRALDYLVRRVAAGPIERIDWSRSWRPPDEKKPGLTLYLGSDPDAVDNIIRLAGLTPVYGAVPDDDAPKAAWRSPKRRPADIAIPPGMSREEALRALEDAKAAYYATKKKPAKKPRRKK